MKPLLDIKKYILWENWKIRHFGDCFGELEQKRSFVSLAEVDEIAY